MKRHQEKSGPPPCVGVLLLLLLGWVLGGAPVECQAASGAPARVVTHYAVISAPNTESPDPRDWRLLGSNDDGRNWTLLDAQTNQVFKDRSERRVYAISNRTAYTTCRFQVEHQEEVQLAELELLGPAVGVESEAGLYAATSASNEHPALGPAADAFDHDPDTYWLGFSGADKVCWLQCTYTRNPELLVTNLSQAWLLAQRAASRNPLAERAPQILSNLAAQANQPLRTLRGYALTSANDFPSRDPRDWRLLGSNDGGKTWNTLDTRRNELFSTRFQKRVFALAKPAAYALYRLAIDSVRAPEGLPGGANSIQLAEIEPLTDHRDGGAKLSLVVSAQGEHAPMETAVAAFDGKAGTKWLDFATAGGTNKSTWIQWQYLAGEPTPVINLRRLSALRTRPLQPIRLRLEGVLVWRNAEAGTLCLVDGTSFQRFKLGAPLGPAQAGDRVRLAGRLELTPEGWLVREPELTRLGALPAADFQPGQPLAEGQSFFVGSAEGQVESISIDPAQLGFRLVGTNGEMQVKVVNPPAPPIGLPAGCRARVWGIVEPLFDADGLRVAGRLWVPDMDHFAPAAAKPSDWDPWPTYSLEDLWRTNRLVLRGTPVRVAGRFTNAAAGLLTLTGRDGAQLTVQTQGPSTFPAGAVVEAIGFLDREGLKPVLRLAQCRGRVSAPAPPDGSATPDITSGPATRIRQIYDRLAKAPNKPFPVKFRGVITLVNLGFGYFYVQDGRDAVRLTGQGVAGLGPRLHQEGLYVEVSGQVIPKPGSAGVAPPIKITEPPKILGRGRMPVPRRSSWDALTSGRDDSQWVQVEGVVNECRDNRLTLALTGGRLMVWFNDLDLADPEQLLGSVVRINGVCEAVRNTRQRRLGVRLIAPTQQCIEVVRAAPSDPFRLRTLPLGRVMESSSQNSSEPTGLLKTAGVVTYATPRLLFVQDGDEGLRVYPRSDVHVRPGDQVEVVGFAEPDGFSPKLTQALVRKVGAAPLPPAAPIDFSQSELNVQDATRRQLDGTIVGISARESTQVLEVREAAEKRNFLAIIPTPRNLASHLALGSRVRLTGVFKAVTDVLPDFGQAMTSFQMYLSSPDDIRVLARPSWWTAQHALFGVGALGLILLLVLAWVSLLRNRVRLRTAELRSEIAEHKQAKLALQTSERFMRSLVESTPGNILRKDLDGRITFANQLFCRTLAKPMEQVVGKTDYDLFPPALAAKYRCDDAEVMKNAKTFETVEENRDADGRKIYVQVIKTPLFDADNRPVGLQALFWDVTARQEAEARLEAAQRGLVEASRKAGMAEVATGVLHNVGNVLNSVNVSAAIVADIHKRSRLGGLPKTVALLREHQDDLPAFLTQDPRGLQIVDYLGQLADHLAAEQNASAKEIKELAANIDHIKEIVAMQQNYAKFVGVTEVVGVAELVEDSLRLNAGALARHDIQLSRQYHPAPLRVTVEKHKVIQILTNLIQNAKYACDDARRRDKQMRIGIQNGDGRVRISVADNGVGIPPANLTRIFSHGFTTRRNGHGFGLHSGALAAREMGGTLTASSDGPGQGATFTLELPLSR